MNEISEKFKEWFLGLNDIEKCIFIKDKAKEVNNNHKKMIKSSNAEFDFKGCRTGIRGGKMTTLLVNNERATKAYLTSVEELKYIVKQL